MEVLPAAAFTSFGESWNPFTPGDQFSWHGSAFILFSKAPEEPSKTMTVSFGLFWHCGKCRIQGGFFFSTDRHCATSI